MRNDLGYAPDSLLYRWTKSAIECYKIGCKCSICNMPQIKETKEKCGMKAVVLELVRRFGAPKDDD